MIMFDFRNDHFRNNLTLIYFKEFVMNQKNCMVAQSGGPTVAINASLAGVIDGVSASSMYDTVYGSLNGITGILNDDLLNLTELMDGHPEYLTRLAQTPAMYLGSCPLTNLPIIWMMIHPMSHIKQFETYHIEAFFYIGGNDSMDTVLKLSEYGNASAVPSALSASRRPSTMISARPITPRALALPQNTLPPRS